LSTEGANNVVGHPEAQPLAKENKMAKANKGNSNVAELIAAASGTINAQQTALLEARQNLVGEAETAVSEAASNVATINAQIAEIDQTLTGTLGFEGELGTPDLSPLNSIVGTAPAAPQRRTRSRSASNGGSTGPRGSKSMPMQDAICIALCRLDAGPESDGVDPDAVLAAVTANPIGYTLSGNPENHSNIISQNLSRAKGDGWVEQVPMEGRKRGLPYRLTTEGMTWVQQNAGTLIQPSRRTDEWVENPSATDESDEG